MSLNTTLLKVLNINPHEKSRVILLLLHSFFIGVYVSYFISFANGIFLSEFEIKYLPLAYIVSGLLGFLTSIFFSIGQRKFKYYNLLVGVLISVLVVTLLFVAGFKILGDNKSLIFIVFVFGGPLFSLMYLSFWGLTISLFDLREGKRLFGLIGSGDVVSAILGYFSIPFVVRIIGDHSNLLVIAAIGLSLSILFQWITITRLPEAKEVQFVAKNKKQGKALSFRDIVENKYFKFIFLLVILSSIGRYFVDYNFMGAAKSHMQDKIQLTSFIGIFFGLVKIVELLFRTFAAGRLMSKYGIKLGLLILPILLLFFTLIALISFAVASYTLLFFLILSMIKLIDKVIRRAMEEPAIKTLYQPVEANAKLLIQTTMEGKGKQLAVMLAGVILILFNLIPDFSIVYTAVISCFLIVAWIIYAYRTYGEYRVLLNKQLISSSEEDDHTQDLNKDIYFSRGIDSDNISTRRRSLFALHEMKPSALISHYPNLINHPEEELRSQALKWVKEQPIFTLSDSLKKQVAFEKNTENLKTINDSIEWESSVLDVSESEMKDLVRSENVNDRIKAAAWICHHKKESTSYLLDVLLKDKDPRVVKATCFYISSINNPDFLKSMVTDIIDNKSYEHSVFKTLLLSTNKANQLLNICFNEFKSEKKFVLLDKAFKESLNNSIKTLGIINTLGKSYNDHAKDYLKSKLDIGNWAIQYYLLENLKRIGHKASDYELTLFRQLILKETGFCTWILASINDLGKGDNIAVLKTSLNEQLASSKTKIFNILSFLYPKEAIEKIEANLRSGIQEKEVLALEMADILLDEIHKDIIFPLFDKIPVAEKVKNLRQHFPQEVMTQEDRLKNIIFYDYALLDNVTKAFAIKALSAKSESLPFEITAQIYSNDNLLKETAYEAIKNRDVRLFEEYIDRENEKTKLNLLKTLTRSNADNNVLTRLEIASLIKAQPLFNQLPFWKINIIADLFTPVFLEANQHFNRDVSFEEKIHVFIKGSIQNELDDGSGIMLKSGDLFGFYDLGLSKRELTVLEDSILLSISKSNFLIILEGFPDVCKLIFNLFMAADFSPDEESDIEEEMYIEYA